MIKEVLAEQLKGYAKNALHIPQVWTSIHERRYSISDIGVTHRWVTYWDQQGILLQPQESGKWRKFNLVEYVWMEAVKKMRAYSVPLTIIKTARDTLCKVEIDKSDQAVADSGKLIELLGGDKEAVEIDAEDAKQILAADNYLSFFLLQMVIAKESFALLINEKGEYLPFNDNMYPVLLEHPQFGAFLRNSYIRISLSDILVRIMTDWSTEHIFEKMRIITEAESQVLEAIRKEKVISVNVKLGHDKHIELIESTTVEPVKTKHDLLDLIMREGYQEINVKTELGKVVHCKNITKTKPIE